MIHPDSMITRRGMLLFAATQPLSAGSSEFWSRKDPSEWSADEVDRLITKSTWAKEIAAPAVGRSRVGPQYHGLVRWESAKPILEAMKTALPGEFLNHYVISVSGLPMSSLRPATGGTDADARARQREVEGVLDKLKAVTRLELKGAARVQPEIVQETQFGVGETRTMLFGFSKTLLQLSLEDQEAVFTTQMGTIPVKAKFNLKEMMYRGELAV